MNVTNNLMGPALAPSPSPFLTRREKSADFLSSALPIALLGSMRGLGGISAQNGAALPAASAAQAALTSGALGVGGAASSALSTTGGIIGALQLALNWGKSSPTAGATSGLALGASIGTAMCPGLGTAVGAGLGAIFGGLIGAITCGKHRDQKVRDVVRQELIQLGVLNTDFALPLPDGTSYDMGKDGGPREEFGGRRPYEVDLSNPLARYAIGWVDPLVQLLAPGNTKIRNDFAGYFANAALSNAKTLADVKMNIDYFVKKFGLTDESLVSGIAQMARGGYLEQSLAQAWVDGVVQRAQLTESEAGGLVNKSSA